MKIVFYNHTGQVSGAERLLLTAVTRLDGGEFDRTIVCPAEGPLAQMAADAGVRVQTVANLNARFTWRPDRFAGYCKSFYQVIADVRRTLIGLNPDLVHANSIRAGLVTAVAASGLKMKVVWHLHDSLPRHPVSCLVRIVAALSPRSRMIAVSEAVGRNFAGRLSWLLNRKLKVILNAIDLKRFSTDGDDREEIRARLSLARDDFAIGIVGQLTPRKGQLELLAAFEKLSKEAPRARLLIIGAALFNRDSDYEQLLRDTTRRLGIADRVLMLGSRNDVPEVMRALDLLVINSRREPFGLIACEAMASGTPVVATNCDGLAEIISHRKTGWLVPFGDQKALVDALAFLIEQPKTRKDLAGAALNDVQQRFAFERLIDEFEKFYRTVCKDTSARRTETSAPGKVPATEFAQGLADERI